MPEIVLEKLHPDARTPARGTPGAAGYDVCAFIHDPFTLMPGERALIPTGLRMRIPPDWEVQVRPRSGLALKHGITVLNTPGTIDSDYRGEICVILLNTSGQPFEIRRGDRIAQLIALSTYAIQFEEGPVDDETSRGSGGFGSTGQ
jgi:dUTP pyrophosphatase